MPHVVIIKDEERGGACPICLEEWLEGDVAEEMPCKAQFPLKACRSGWGDMPRVRCAGTRWPVEEVEGEKKAGVWIGFSVSAGARRNEEEDGGRRSDGDSDPRDETES
ncbi:unnamed protein product [Eruca vesicaria subsp. sativa]|uniref:RING-type domain-containing protein n=1 Tax=Eruca vesicaria subsp. sativa TaxID=29727 RepID=A0ABC8IX77_ERUVS|nr:unnamed protein product [Eruca vesicaria subsp. sativa]